MRIQPTNNQNFTGTFQVRAKGTALDLIKMMQGHNPTGFDSSSYKGSTDISASYEQEADVAVFTALSKLRASFAYLSQHGLNDQQLDGLHITALNHNELLKPRVILEG